jgi:hypothetical protein
MKSEIGSSRGGLRPYPLRFHVEEAGADAKLNQYDPLEVAYHRRHPISTVPVARITAHATVPDFFFKSLKTKQLIITASKKTYISKSLNNLEASASNSSSNSDWNC